MRITEPTNNDYDNDVSDNCDHNFGTFDDFGVKNDQKVSNNMILMSNLIVKLYIIYYIRITNAGPAEDEQGEMMPLDAGKLSFAAIG